MLKLLDTIAAIATPLAQGAISIIRISGDDALAVINKIFSKDLSNVASHTLHYGYIKEDNQLIDEVIVSVFLAPKTFTRENIIEINTHGGVFITKKILSLVLANGARLALPGEFTKRAVINGRIDLTQAESIDDIISARSDNEMAIAMRSLRGSVKKILDPFIDSLLNMIATIEVNIDYPEYDDIEQVTVANLQVNIEKWLKNIDLILNHAKSGKIMREGIKTAIIGRPNVGKSSLLNAFLEEDKAIVSDIAGTTRDIVEGFVRLPTVTLQLLDTAGIRDSEDVIEQIGIDKSKKTIEESDLVLLVLDASKPLTEYDNQLLELTKNKNTIVVYNKKDIALQQYDLMISAQQNDIGDLINKIEAYYAQHTFALREDVIANERHISQILKAKYAMQQALYACQNQFEVDLIVIDLENAYTYLKEIFGIVESDDLLDTLFSKFCLGK